MGDLLPSLPFFPSNKRSGAPSIAHLAMGGMLDNKISLNALALAFVVAFLIVIPEGDPLLFFMLGRAGLEPRVYQSTRSGFRSAQDGVPDDRRCSFRV